MPYQIHFSEQYLERGPVVQAVGCRKDFAGGDADEIFLNVPTDEVEAFGSSFILKTLSSFLKVAYHAKNYLMDGTF